MHVGTRSHELEKIEIKHIINEEQKQLLEKVEEILQKEREMTLREEKILEIEERIEKDLGKQKQAPVSDSKFFSKEFVQGLVTGFLITLIGLLLYIKFIS